MRIATWNVNSLKARQPRVEQWLADVAPDVLCLQETKLSNDAFPALAFSALGYEAVHHGEGRWNGVAILSRRGVDDVVDGFAPGIEPDAEARALTATCGGVRVTTVYVPNGRALDHPLYEHKLEWLDRLRRHLEATADPGDDVVVCGDFNVAPDDRDVWDASACHGGTHVSAPERAALAAVVGWGLVDTFRQRHPEDGLFSWWDYRAGNFHKHLGMRIDLLYASVPLAERLSWVMIDRNARKGKLPSDHAPVVAEFCAV
ncbi:MAG: exodeoxyribonuclease III [Acidimicrobiales bacterium]